MSEVTDVSPGNLDSSFRSILFLKRLLLCWLINSVAQIF